MDFWRGLDDTESRFLGDDLFKRFGELIHDMTGLYFSENSRFFFERRIQNRLDALGDLSPRDYLHYLVYDPEKAREWDALIALLTTNETYFMREENQLRCFQKDILPALLERKPPEAIRIWSAGCSTGEEPYSIAILLNQARAFTKARVQIVATDINSRVLSKAKRGVYTESAFRSVDESFKDRWFLEESTGRYRIREEIRKRVSFSWFNLFELNQYSTLKAFDVIFCRNVIIYFDMDAKAKVVNRFWQTLHSGGFLLLGHSESLISVTDRFHLVHLPHDLVYTKGE